MIEKELHTIKKFRAGNMGIIRLNELAYPANIIVKIGEEEFTPVGYDTYGHPIISEENFAYYKALKSIRERNGESLIAEVKYKKQPFVVRRDVYDSVDGIKEIEKRDSLKELKRILIYRRQAKFLGKELKTFILYGRYALNNDGRIYLCSYNRKYRATPGEVVLNMSEVVNFKLNEEVHIPGADDVCAICGKKFNINDIKNFSVTEDVNCRKVHSHCLINYREAVNYQNASKIIDSVYRDTPKSRVIREIDPEDKKEKVWYVYYTKQGDVAIRFKNKVIEIKWFGNFKPFSLEKLFEYEDVTKRKFPNYKIIHAWSMDDAIKYLTMVRKS